MLPLALACFVAVALCVEATSPYEFHALLDAQELYAAAQQKRHPQRPATQTPVLGCSSTSTSARPTRRSTRCSSGRSPRSSTPRRRTPCTSTSTRGSSTTSARRRWPAAISSSRSPTARACSASCAPRRQPPAGASSWGASFSAAYATRALASASVTLGAGAAPCDAARGGCSRRASENFEVVFVLGRRTSVVGLAAGGNAAGGVEFSDDLRGGGGGAPLRVALYAAAPEHAFELGALEVRVERLEREQALTAFASPAEFAASASNERFAALWPAHALRAADGALLLAPEGRGAQLLKDGCGVEFRAAAVALPGVAYGGLVALPLVEAGRLRRDRQYVLHVAVVADSNTPRNQLLVGVADGVESGAHVVGFARADRAAAPVLGAAFGGLLTRTDAQLYVETSQFVALDAGTAGAQPARRFEFDIVVGGGSTRVVASAANAVASGDAFVDTDRFGLDVTSALYIVAMQRSDRTSESSTLRLLSVAIDEVRIGCDGVANSRKLLDACGVCGGDNACVGCDGVPLSGKLVDACGVCAGDGSSCADCAGVPHGTSRVDDCGVCNGDNRCLLGSASAERNAAFRKAHAEKYAADGNIYDDDARKRSTHHHDDDDDDKHRREQHYHREQQQQQQSYGAPSNGSAASGNCTNGCGDEVDCSGRLVREGGVLKYDACGVCGGANECVGCDGAAFGKSYDACGACGGHNTTCCINYSDVPDAYWDFMLLPVTLDNIIEKLELTYAAIAYVDAQLPASSVVDNSTATALQVGRMAEFNRIFLYDCLDVFCAESSDLFQKLVVDNNPIRVQMKKQFLDLGSI